MWLCGVATSQKALTAGCSSSCGRWSSSRSSPSCGARPSATLSLFRPRPHPFFGRCWLTAALLTCFVSCSKSEYRLDTFHRTTPVVASATATWNRACSFSPALALTSEHPTIERRGLMVLKRAARSSGCTHSVFISDDRRDNLGLPSPLCRDGVATAPASSAGAAAAGVRVALAGPSTAGAALEASVATGATPPVEMPGRPVPSSSVMDGWCIASGAWMHSLSTGSDRPNRFPPFCRMALMAVFNVSFSEGCTVVRRQAAR
mmetsp:Transcript_14793/g.43799  ORF Transcript_14793/g.43799 Transcript_14793/m.43799 type:complete len:261 (-) Transcript_14793:141-923(-)